MLYLQSVSPLVVLLLHWVLSQREIVLHIEVSLFFIVQFCEHCLRIQSILIEILFNFSFFRWSERFLVNCLIGFHLEPPYLFFDPRNALIDFFLSLLKYSLSLRSLLMDKIDLLSTWVLKSGCGPGLLQNRHSLGLQVGFSTWLIWLQLVSESLIGCILFLLRM